ncbi:MAG: bifunctional phosphopantothenoylcysteine decarboxylase/phosphopantothenate--cysteine ligase CoaBC [Pyrinomonadaceae bacterium]
MNEDKKYRIGLGVSGGIAAYKAIEVLRLLQKSGCEVQVAMTKHATEFIRPLTFRALTGKYVIVDDYDPDNPDPIAHVNFSQGIDLLLIVPATANIIAKFANGIADDFLTSTYLASDAPVLIAPAMNVEMWDHPATQRNIGMLEADGVEFIEPVSGELACKTIGTGKLEDVENIVEQALSLLSKKKRVVSDLAGERILITVGGTREAIDPVRFISNSSSGKMGFALAKAAFERGAEVTVVKGVTSVNPPSGLNIVSGDSAQEMFDKTFDHLPDSTIFIGAAAVADYRPKISSESKIKKERNDSLSLELERTQDILAAVSEKRHNGLLVVGFAAETNNIVEYAKSKMERKNLDMIVANDVTKKGAGFNSDTNIATILTKADGTSTEVPLMKKSELAHRILDKVAEIRRKK